MTPVDPSAILGLWEDNRGLDVINRSVGLCAAAEPAISADMACDISIGERNERLLRLRSAWSDDRLEATAQCPECGITLAFDIDPHDLLAASRRTDREPLHVGEREVHWRPVTSRDLLNARHAPDGASAERVIIGGCVQDVIEGGRTLVGYQPTDSERAALAAAIDGADPLCDLLFDLDCVGCGLTVSASLQIPDVVWSELDIVARRLVSDVHTLAAAYGWTEADCFALSASRRAIYVESAGLR